jgi:hypothetical protein
MRFPLSDEDCQEIERYQLRSSCQHCFFFIADSRRCAHEWPVEGQIDWPLCGEDGHQRATEIGLCKEFELR